MGKRRLAQRREASVPTLQQDLSSAPEQSANLRERLVAQLACINSADEAAAWAHRNLPAKNTLTAGDAQIVEEEFRVRLLRDRGSPRRKWSIQCCIKSSCPPISPMRAPIQKHRERPGNSHARVQSVRWAKWFACAIRSTGSSWLGRHAWSVAGRGRIRITSRLPNLARLDSRVSDEFTVPVCRIHHRELHRSGDEAAWWRKLNIDPLPVALRLWQHTRGDGEFGPTTGRHNTGADREDTDLPAQDQASTNFDPGTAARRTAPK